MFDVKRFLYTTIIITITVILGCVITGDHNLAVQIFISGIIFYLNLFGWIWSSKIVVGLQNNRGNSVILTILSAMRVVLFFTCIIGILLAFGVVPVLIGNSIIVVSLLGTTLYHILKDHISK